MCVYNNEFEHFLQILVTLALQNVCFRVFYLAFVVAVSDFLLPENENEKGNSVQIDQQILPYL